MRTFKWNRETKLDSIPGWLFKLIPPTTCLDELDKDDQFNHVRYRVQHEIDIFDEEGQDYSGMTLKQYRDAKKFLDATKN